MKSDPPVRKDGRCWDCQEPRRPERSRKYGKAAAELDPFCSVECARRYHGTSLPENMASGRPAQFPKED